MFTLRPYQVEVVAQARECVRRGVKRFIIVMATGGGKTPAACGLIAGAVQKGTRVLVIARRRELINQMSRKLSSFDVEHGVVMANHKRWRPYDYVQVASIDTLIRRLDKHPYTDWKFGLIVIDECHHAAAPSIMSIMDRWPDAIVVGLTATPCRADKKPLGKVYRYEKKEDGRLYPVEVEREIFQELILGPQIKELVGIRALVPVDGFSYSKVDLQGVKLNRNGDYDDRELDTAMREVVVGGSVIKDYLEHARGMRALVFAVNIAHSKAIVSQAIEAGIPAAHIDDSTPSEEREAVLGPGGKLERGEVLLVSNVGIATEGTDCPSVEVIVLVRPTKSFALARQMFGRGMRTWCFDCRDGPKDLCWQSHRVKRSCRIHDHAGIMTDPDIGLPDGDVDWSLDHEPTIKHECQKKQCPTCKAVVAISTQTCPHCGTSLLTIEGIQHLVIREEKGAQRLSIEELRKRRPEGVRELTDAQLVKVHRATRVEKAAEYLRLKAVQTEKGFKPGFVDQQFKAVFAHWPRFSDEELADVQPAQRPFIPLPPRREST